MTKSKSKSTAGADAADVRTPIEEVRSLADALYRSAQECCRQHDRLARLIARAGDQPDEADIQASCHACDGALRELVARYEAAAASVRPDKDAPWWRPANALWLASRDYLRHHEGCDALTRRMSQHDAQRLTNLHTEYELEASALLGLRHASDAYSKARPDVH
ncbi:MAG: hypothetical protein JWO05_2253 [Gemmatimonadetes bacterium]|nr:hypothetical protein [Gemmatimonadota bacterium]